jgi:SAM-dependent methyltransferase
MSIRYLRYNRSMDIKASISEDHGIATLTDDDLEIYSVGISTGGVAEIHMAEASPRRHIIATTIDKKGVEFAQKYIAEKHLEGQIEEKIEDIAEPLPYPDGHFDYIYARLVLHYLPEDKLVAALAELYRVLRLGGKLFVVVRSTNCPDAKRKEAHFDPMTKLTTCTLTDDKTGKTYSYSRYFHTEQSIREYVARAGFNVSYAKAYDEHLYVDFMRTKLSPEIDNVIELLAFK